MIEIIEIKAFSQPIYFYPGDDVRVSHTLHDQNGDKVLTREVSKHDITMRGLWSHSILYKLNGQLQMTVGDRSTIEWLTGLAG